MEEFRITHIDILKRFYLMFESVYRYATDLVSFTQQVKEGIYVSHTVEVCRHLPLVFFYSLTTLRPS